MQFLQRILPSFCHSQSTATLNFKSIFILNSAPNKAAAAAVSDKTCEPAAAAATAATANNDGWTLKAVSAVHRTATVCTPADGQQQCMDLHPSMELTAADIGNAGTASPSEAGAVMLVPSFSLDLELSAEEAIALVQPAPMPTEVLQSAPARPSKASQPKKQGRRQLKRLITGSSTLMRQASDNLRRGAKRLRASLSTPSCFTAGAQHSTFAPTNAEGWTKTHVNWA